MTAAEKLLAVCACTRVRSVARVLTRAYDDVLRTTGLKASQLAVLAAIDASEAVSIAELSKTLFMDRTTLSRNLKPLVAGRLITLSEEGWRRSKTVQMTRSGKAMLESALPLWQQAQDSVTHRFGKKRWQVVDGHLQDLLAAHELVSD
jgi:DNA-binding MarR family transcriptional regulator